MKHQPTVFHITHPKSGSQWVAEVLKYCAPTQFVPPKRRVAHVRKVPIRPGSVYPTVYLPKLDSDALIIKYEDLILDEYMLFEKMVDYCDIKVSRQRLHEIVRYNSFEAVTGRKPGQEDVAVHQRKGIAGDWRNHFSEPVSAEFKRRFGQVLIQTGYEPDLNW